MIEKVKEGEGFGFKILKIKLGTSDDKNLINAGVNVNVIDDSGYTALTYAIFFGNTGIIKLLINAKANVKPRGTDIYTNPLSLAINSQSSIDVIRMLIKAGANINATVENDFTPLIIITVILVIALIMVAIALRRKR